MTLGKALARSALANGVRGPVTVKGMDKTLTQCNSELLDLKAVDPRAILGQLQRNGEPILNEARR
ncbi:hypothetical protein ACIHCV_27335 [Streptomyces sp. NPDC051956]|uniref:hypothetical protein n=1 Tax=Streptomyces sp. NPDC051956 TaxID=3365677 RepID=UPI0037CEFB2C